MFALETRRRTTWCRLCGSGTRRVAVIVQRQWHRRAWRNVKRVRALCLVCIQEIKRAAPPGQT